MRDSRAAWRVQDGDTEVAEAAASALQQVATDAERLQRFLQSRQEQLQAVMDNEDAVTRSRGLALMVRFAAASPEAAQAVLSSGARPPPSPRSSNWGRPTRDVSHLQPGVLSSWASRGVHSRGGQSWWGTPPFDAAGSAHAHLQPQLDVPSWTSAVCLDSKPLPLVPRRTAAWLHPQQDTTAVDSSVPPAIRGVLFCLSMCLWQPENVSRLAQLEDHSWQVTLFTYCG